MAFRLWSSGLALKNFGAQLLELIRAVMSMTRSYQRDTLKLLGSTKAKAGPTGPAFIVACCRTYSAGHVTDWISENEFAESVHLL